MNELLFYFLPKIKLYEGFVYWVVSVSHLLACRTTPPYRFHGTVSILLIICCHPYSHSTDSSKFQYIK
jgi:hypothetical protein